MCQRHLRHTARISSALELSLVWQFRVHVEVTDLIARAATNASRVPATTAALFHRLGVLMEPANYVMD